MRQIILARLFVCLILFTAVATTAQAQNVNSANLIKQLLDLPAPAPTDVNTPVPNRTNDRPSPFFEKSQVPPDDAPIEDLVDYWGRQSRDYRDLRYSVKPSEKTLARLLEYCEENPEQLRQLIGIFPAKPEIAEVVKKIYDRLAEKAPSDYGTTQIRTWLVYRSVFFVDELVKKSEKVVDKDEYVTNQDELLALGRVDWDKAAPIVERLMASEKTQPVSAVLARWAYYERALERGDELDVSKYRRQLQDVVEDSRALPGARDLALDALVSGGDWDGRDDWYVTLLGDETLYDLKVNGRSYTGLTTLLLYSPPEKYVQLMVGLVDHKNPVIRRAAIKNLTVHLSGEKPPVEAVRALLPWLTNPNWAPDFPGGRAQVINALGKVDLPEAVPALITLLTTEEDNRDNIAEALGRYKDQRAIPALKAALAKEKAGYRRGGLIKALDACGGLSDDEKMAALEAYAEAVATPEAAEEFSNNLYRDYEEDEQNPMPVVVNIGSYVANETDPGDGVVMRAIEREKKLRKTKPMVAASLFRIMQGWRGPIIYVEKLRRIRTGEADLDTILLALAQRREIRQKNENDILAMRAAGGVAHGIAACLLEDAADFGSILRQTDTDALTAALGCGRLLRVKLPVAEVGPFLKNANKTVALAAERYLESEDSPQARTLILANRPGEALILGARELFVPDPKNYVLSQPMRDLLESIGARAYTTINYPAMDKRENALRDEIKANPDLLAVYGILRNGAAGHQLIRVFKDKVVFTDYEDEARYRERVLTGKEYEDFYRLVLDEKIDTAAPFFGACSQCQPGEFVMFGKNGGRRMFFVDAASELSPVKKLAERIESFNDGNLKLHYRLADSIKGLEVLLAEDKYKAQAIWKNGADLRVLIEDKEKEAEIKKELITEFEAQNKQAEDETPEQARARREYQEKRYQESLFAHFFWRNLENGRLGAISAQPLETPYLYDETQVPETVGINMAPRAWKVRAGNYEIRVTGGYNEEKGGVYKTSRSEQPLLFKKGKYNFPVVTGDGKWVVVTKIANDWPNPCTAMRINLETAKEFPVNLPPAGILKPIAFIAAQNKVLLYRGKRMDYYNYRPDNGDDNDEEEEVEVKPSVPATKDPKNPNNPETPEYYLLDAATGATQLVKGEFRPLEDETYRPLQPVDASPGEFWAALYDKKAKETTIGRYNTKTFTFQTILKLPQIKLNSMDIWVDEKEAKIYFVYEGHVLSAPLPK